jgi:hypothetical protein
MTKPGTPQLVVALDPYTRHDLERLMAITRLSKIEATRLALREACERRGIPGLDREKER